MFYFKSGISFALCSWFSHNCGSTHWTDPRLGKSIDDASTQEAPTDEALGRMPPGWERVDDPTYGTYYIEWAMWQSLLLR